MKVSSVGPLLLVLGIYVVISGVVFDKINEVQPKPYMDEIFHVPQTQKYCNGTFDKWDPKITTLPGTYFMAMGMLSWTTKLGVNEPCSVYLLRAYNVLISCLNLVLVYAILGYYMLNSSDSKRAFAAFNIASFPVLYFFSFLYYTDGTATALMLMMHLFFLKQKFEISAMCGGLAVFTRQTNVIWVIWHGALCFWNIATSLLEDFCYESENIALQRADGPRKKTVPFRKENLQIADLRQYFQPEMRIQSLKLMLTLSWKKIWKQDVMGTAGLYGLVVFLFGVFVLINGGIVVGDKQAHQVTINTPQIGYFAMVFGFFCFPFILRRLKMTLQFGIHNSYWLVSVLAVGLIAVVYNSVAHPYLLADNRHYTFYIWKRFFQGHFDIRCLMVPWYIFFWSFMWVSMDATLAYRWSFLVCCMLNLIPQMLLEFRYFIPCYLLARLVMRDVNWTELIVEYLAYTVINVFTVYMFLYKPFAWPSEVDPQRFMW